MIDIIIPTFNDKNNLLKTLQSIPNLPWINITVVDDCSTVSYDDIEQLYPEVSFLHLKENVGPGWARQQAIFNTNEPYIMFIDSGDYFIIENWDKILFALQDNPGIDIFVYRFLKNNKISADTTNNLHAHIYKRQYLQEYNITFSKIGSYANEDIGFNHLCRLIEKQYYPDKSNILTIENVIMIYDTTDLNSITRENNNIFVYTKQAIGLSYNAVHAYNCAKQNGVAEDILNIYANDMMCSLYYYFIRTLEEKPEYIKNAWAGARYYYINLFKNIKQQNFSYFRIVSYYSRISRKPKIRLNIPHFLTELEQNENVPSHYLT